MKLSIRWTILISCIALVWVTHLILTPSSYFMTKRVMTRHMQDVMVNISNLALEQANNHLKKARSAASIDKQLLGSNVVSNEMEATGGLERYFFDQLSMYPHLSALYVGGLNGNFFMVTRDSQFQPDGFLTMIIRHDNGIRTTKHIWRDSNFMLYHFENDPANSYDPRSRIWFKKVMEQKKMVWTDPYIFYSVRKPGVTIAGPAYDQGGEIKGIIGVDIELEELSSFINNLQVGKSGKAFIIHRNGDVITHDDSASLNRSSGESASLRLPKVEEVNNLIIRESFGAVAWQRDTAGSLQLDKPEMTIFKQDGKTYLSMYTPFPTPELPWIIGVYIPEDDYLAEIKSNQLINIIATLIITLLASIIGLFLAGRIAGPIVKLAEGAKAIENNDITPPIQIHSAFREIQETTDSFARMRESISDYKNKLLDKEEIYRVITRTVNDAIIMTDSNHAVTYFNPAAEKMFGYPADEVIGKKLVEFLVPRQDEQSYQRGVAKFMENETDAFEDRTIRAVAMCRNGREIPIELSLSKLKLNDVWHAVATIRNIKERQREELLRKRLVNDLHDGIGGSLTNIKLLAEMSRTHDIPEHTSINLRYIAEISMDCITEIRNYMNILDDTELSWQSLTAELHQYCARALEPHNIKFAMPLDIYDEIPPPTTLLYMNVFKIVKEAMNNVIKHSGGDSVKLETRIGENSARWIIKDNGVGNISSLNGGRGLLSMTSRTEELGGNIRFSWSDGARIVLNIPFTRTTVREPMLRDRNPTKPVA